MRERFDAAKEHEIIGNYPGTMGVQLGDFDGVPETPRFYRPIDARDNMKMLLLEGKTPYWIPHCGWFFCDINEFRPRQHADNLGNHQCIDGGGAVDWKALGMVVNGWFDLPLEWEPMSMGATVRPGNPLMEEINGWEKVLKFPNLDDIDFEEMKNMNQKFFDHDKANQLGIQFTFWERLMNIMGVDNAAMALLDEDQADEMHAFLDRLADLYVDYIRRVNEVLPLDAVMMHDDWGTQNGPFFSLETAMEFFVPAHKKVVDFCHSKGIIYEHHCCGNASKLVPAMEACGTDFWFPQAAINNLDELIETHKNDHITFAVSNPILPIGSSPEQIRDMAAQWVEKYKDKGILLCMNVNLTPEDGHDGSLYPIFADAVYEFSRIAYQEAD